MTETILRTYNLSKKYNDKYAVNNVDIEIRRGQIFGLVGLNGAGKTTLMRMIAGVAFPSDGVIELFGMRNRSGLNKTRKKLAQTIETPAIYPSLTARGNLEIQRMLSDNHDKPATDEILELVGLAGTGKKKAKDFSLGMKQRLGLGIALISDPEFLILDEPLNGLDPGGIIEIRELIVKLVKEKEITFMISSHLLDELAKIATDYAFINEGQIVNQLSRKKLAENSSQYIQIESPNMPKLLPFIYENHKGVEVKTIAENRIHLNGYDGNVAALNRELVESGIPIGGIFRSEVSLEDYFMENIGGGHND